MPFKDKARKNEYSRKWIAERKAAWLLEHGPCVKCSSWVNLNVDHIDPKLKISHRIWSWSEERRDLELAKCQVLCYTCHLEKTRIDRGWGIVFHGTLTAYDVYKCRCDLCKKVKSEKNSKRKPRLKAMMENNSRSSTIGGASDL